MTWVRYSETVWTMWFNNKLHDLIETPNGVVWYEDGFMIDTFEDWETAFTRCEETIIREEIIKAYDEQEQNLNVSV